MSGMFENLVASDSEIKYQQREAANQLAAAVYDVRERFGSFLFAARDLEEYRDRLALIRDDAIRTMTPHVFPRSGVIRRVLKPLEAEFRAKLGSSRHQAESYRGDGDVAKESGPFAGPHGSFPVGTEKDLDDAKSVCNMPSVHGKHPGTCDKIEDMSRPKAARVACWPGCHENEEHARKYHKEKESRVADKTGPAMNNDVTFRPSKGDLVPEGDFKGYLDRIDQGAREKVRDRFIDTESPTREHTGDPADTDFAKSAAKFAAWCAQRRVRPSVDSLEVWAAKRPDREYYTVLTALRRQADQDPLSPVQPGAMTGAPGMPAGASSFSNVPGVGEYPVVSPMDKPGSRQHGKPSASRREGEGHGAIVGLPPGEVRSPDPARRNKHPRTPDATEEFGVDQGYLASRRTAAPDYLQKADEALTQLLNQKAEEFQQGVGALQQALQIVQQEEQAMQAANPLNVQPPAGTVNVLPQAPAGMAQAGGGAPPPAAADQSGPAAAPPAAADQGAVPPDPQQLAASLREMVAMAMSRKHYVQMAKLVAGLPPEHKGPLAEGLADMFKADNDRFSHDKWYKAVGHTPQPAMAAVETMPQGPARAAKRGGRPKDDGSVRKESGPSDTQRTSGVIDDYYDWVDKSPGAPRGGESDIEAFANERGVGERAKSQLRQHLFGAQDQRKRGGDDPKAGRVRA